MASIVKSFAISVDIEVKEIYGQPIISIVKLGDTSVKESPLVKSVNIFGFNSLLEVIEFIEADGIIFQLKEILL